MKISGYIRDRLPAAFRRRTKPAGFVTDALLAAFDEELEPAIPGDLRGRGYIRVLADEIVIKPSTRLFWLLNAHGVDRMMPRMGASHARYWITFNRNTATHPTGDLQIPARAIVQKNSATRYLTRTLTILPNGQDSVKAIALAEQPGVAYNAAAGEIATIVTAVTGIQSCANQAGDQIEAAHDEETILNYSTRLTSAFARYKLFGRRQGILDWLADHGVEATITPHHEDFPAHGPQASHWASFTVNVTKLGRLTSRELYEQVRRARAAHERAYFAGSAALPPLRFDGTWTFAGANRLGEL